mgnify:CR=1 FL=1
MASIRRHGYKGALEVAATVDYLYGYDATARIGEDWMYEQVTATYVADPEVRKFFAASNPWALQGIADDAARTGQVAFVKQALGMMTNITEKDKAAAHLQAGAKRVLISAPAKGHDVTVDCVPARLTVITPVVTVGGADDRLYQASEFFRLAFEHTPIGKALAK